MTKPIVWTIAGSDSCAGAGIQSDLLTMHHLGVHACSIITAVTAQNISEVKKSFYLPATIIENQLAATPVPSAIKIGMLGNAEIAYEIEKYLLTFNGAVVLDPLLVSSSGHSLFIGKMADYVASLKSLFPHVTLLTPNRNEAEILLSRHVKNHDDVISAASDLLSLGVKNVVIKGGHFDGQFSHDYWTNGEESFWLSSPRINADCHGTGCVLSSAVTSCLALGYNMKDALVIAKMVINRGLRHAELAHSKYFLHQSGWPEEQCDLPYVSQQPILSLRDRDFCELSNPVHPLSFSYEDQLHIGLYPVVDSVHWLEQLLPLGIQHVQLRIKDKSGKELEDEIAQAVKLGSQFQAKLFINDYWQLAIKYGAYGAHLGQEDLLTADVAAIHAAGLRLGISTHCYEEVARAHACHPSYIAIGPIYATTSKIMPFAPQGLTALQRWRRTLQYPLVAIGGIGLDNISDVLSTGVNGVALISAITASHQPTIATKKLLSEVEKRVA